MIKISVVIPVYNACNVIDTCVNSILNQTYDNYEIILVDDGSTDYSLIRCKEYAEKSNKITVITQPNGGVSNARNTGIRAAKGKWICFLDSDDFVSDKYLENLMQDDYDFVISGICLNNIFFQKNISPIISKVDNKSDLINFISMLDKTGYIFNGPYQKRFNLNIIKENSLFFREDLDYGEDTIFILNYFKLINTSISVNIVDYYYNIGNENSLSTTITFERRFDYLSKLELELFDFINYFKPTSAQKEMILYFFIKQVYATILLNYNGNYSYNDRKKNIKLIKQCLSQSKWYYDKLFNFINYPMYITSIYGLNILNDQLNKLYFYVKRKKNS